MNDVNLPPAPTEVCFVYPAPFGYFPELVEYARAVSGQGMPAAYLGLAERRSTEEDPSGVKIIHVPGKWSHKALRLVDNRAAAQQLILALSVLKPRLVHIFHFRGCALLPALGRGALPAAKWVCDVRSVNVSGRIKWAGNWLTHLESLCFDGTLALTEQIARMLRPARRPPMVIPLGVWPDRFKTTSDRRAAIRRELGIPDGGIVILYAGTLDRNRKLERLLQAFAKVCRESPAYLLVVGGRVRSAGADEDVRRMQVTARELAIDGRARFTGRVSYDAVSSYFAAGDIGVSFVPMESHFQHQPPTKLLEYLVCPNLVPVCTATQASLDLVNNGKCAVVCDDSVDGLASALRRAIEIWGDPERFRAMRQAAAEAVSCRHWSRLIPERLIPYYRGLLCEGRE